VEATNENNKDNATNFSITLNDEGIVCLAFSHHLYNHLQATLLHHLHTQMAAIQHPTVAAVVVIQVVAILVVVDTLLPLLVFFVVADFLFFPLILHPTHLENQ
jgi:hypothetical protein